MVVSFVTADLRKYIICLMSVTYAPIQSDLDGFTVRMKAVYSLHLYPALFYNTKDVLQITQIFLSHFLLILNIALR